MGETAAGIAALLLLTPSLTGYGTLWCWEGCVSQYLKYDFFYSYISKMLLWETGDSMGTLCNIFLTLL